MNASHRHILHCVHSCVTPISSHFTPKARKATRPAAWSRVRRSCVTKGCKGLRRHAWHAPKHRGVSSTPHSKWSSIPAVMFPPSGGWSSVVHSTTERAILSTQSMWMFRAADGSTTFLNLYAQQEQPQTQRCSRRADMGGLCRWQRKERNASREASGHL
jgi:hypothetical protein